jgi:rare lipoprotein A
MRKRQLALALLVAPLLLSAGHAQTAAATTDSTPSATAQTTAHEETGLAAVYSDKLAGHLTASGSKYSPTALTAAHKTLPFGTRVRITNVKNGKSVEVKITDRGPRQANRILDITPRAAKALGFSKFRMAEVTLAVL